MPRSDVRVITEWNCLGIAYVALSRATRMEALQVLNFKADKVMAHPRVLEWYRGLGAGVIEDEWDEWDELDPDMIAALEAGAGHHLA